MMHVLGIVRHRCILIGFVTFKKDKRQTRAKFRGDRFILSHIRPQPCTQENRISRQYGDHVSPPSRAKKCVL